jgi:hypothetical protein
VKKAASASCSDGPFTTARHLDDNSDASFDLAIRDPSEPPFTFLYLTGLRRAEAGSLAILALQREHIPREDGDDGNLEDQPVRRKFSSPGGEVKTSYCLAQSNSSRGPWH